MYCKSSLCKTMQRRKRLGLISAFGLMLFLWKTSPYTCTGHLTLHCRVRDTVASLWRAEGEGPRKPCNCEVCISQQNVSSWFDERYNSTIEPLLTAENQDIPVQVQHWWLKLQGSNNGSYLPDILSKMFKVIPPVSHSWARGNAARCQTCAVVGNSGNLKGSKHGQRIDSHNFVLRTYMKVKSFIQADKDKVLIFNPSFFKYIHDKWTSHHGKYPSTGILALFFAIHVCDKVSVFGYGADSFGSWHHYWEKNRFASAFRKTGVHNADFELALIKRLAQEGKVTFYT
ncbi:CMP-N-acetylneuraminate-beta-galactosamide-alpha-2,3-sialyltransferase 1-like isoform X2 [Rhinatrema bivittatum]|uniref:CMP-N-acetylneuraminate-beta-galactosamide- alpha-2,3-sialyltransferase 1-like isoform X2 n=1 Tax=Rhinatrema bivittatum TaxID=194408 RepID=UPI001127B638|nr:CMP-N-acetylneuraminate-beta-galactosamide-alpha-2,3-sialyltransferase 1-like isoform X2 [Rhinatrema bivittatum]